MRPAEKVTRYLGITNLVIGVTSFAGPLVTGNGDRWVNIRPGLWLGIFGMNWLHALLHMAVGLLGLPARRTPRLSVGYMWLHAVLFGFLSAMYAMKARAPSRIHIVMGMALNGPANGVHVAWSVVGLLFALRPGLGGTEQ